MSTSEVSKYKIAIDTMGGDFAPANEVQGAFLAAEQDKSIQIVFVGREKEILNQIDLLPNKSFNYVIENADDIVKMDDDPTIVIKTKKESSLYKGIELHHQGKFDAFVSAGNTGAMLSTATVLLGRISGVSRPTIGTFFPTNGTKYALVLDVGATLDSRSRFLFEYAIMGSLYVKAVYGVSNPKVGLLNVGEEPSKGTDVIKETYKLLSESSLNFIGNIEGRDILQGKADVVVCDGFTGNILLKFAESFLGLFKSKVKGYAERNLMNKLKVLAIKPVIKDIMREFDYQTYGGVPLLGVNGNIIIGHGGSTPKAIKNMILIAKDLVEKDLIKRIETALAEESLSAKQINK